MSLPKLTVDTEISLDVRDPSLPRVISPNSREKLDSLENVLEAVQQFKRVDRHQLQMMRTAAGHLAEFLNLDLKQIHLDQLITPAVEFKKFLKNHRYKCNAIRSYVHYLRLIVKNAEALGWKPRSPEIPAEWKVIYDVARKQGCGTIVRYAIENRKRPMEFGDADHKTLYIAARTSVYKIRVNIPGIP